MLSVFYKVSDCRFCAYVYEYMYTCLCDIKKIAILKKIGY